MKPKALIIRFVLILVFGGVAYWQKSKDGGRGNTSADRGNGNSAPAISSSGDQKKVGKYDVLEGCRLVENKNNDGDSFFVRHGNRDIEIRLYFVDAPEKYLSDRYESQRRRVEEQARDFGGISVNDTVEVGLEAKAFAKSQLNGKSFDVYTYWEEVYDGDRYYCFVELPGSGEYLGTALVRNGLARIHTKGPGSKQNPVPTPKGDSFFKHRDRLTAIERDAKNARLGAWGK